MNEDPMMTALSSMTHQGSELSPGSVPASSSERLVQTSHTRACMNCVRAKAKCSIGVGYRLKCERCHRMNKDCRPSPPMRRRRIMKRHSASETSKLEEKLDGLVTLLKSATQGVPGILNATSINTPLEGVGSSNHDSASSAAVELNVGNRDYISLPSEGGFPGSHFTPAASSSSESTLVNLQPPILHPDLQPNPEDAESYLNNFRTVFVKHLPFIVLSPSVTSHKLRKERPILWVCIMAAASSKSTQQIALSNEVRAIIGREAYVEGTGNMDLLLGILVYAAWDQRHSLERPIFLSLVQLAIAILYELGLDKPPSKDPALILAYDMKGIGKPSRLSRFPTMEERRSLLACFLISSLSSSFLRKGDTLRWTAYSNECLRVIETQKEFESDVVLVQLVKLRLISERVTDAPWSGPTTQVDLVAKPPATFYLKSLEAQLHDFKSNIPCGIADNKTLLMELHDTDLRIHEIGLSQAPDIFSGQYNRRLECLYACLNAAKCWVAVFLSIPPAQYVGFSTSIYVNLVHCFVSIYRLSTFEHPEWDRRLVRENLDVSLFLEKTERNFSQVKEEAGLDLDGSEDMDVFSIMAAKARGFKMWWEVTTVPTIGSGDEMGDFSMEFLDDNWLRDVLSPWNE